MFGKICLDGVADINLNNMSKRNKAIPPNINEFTLEGKLPMWNPNDLIRRRDTGVAVLVVHVFRNATLIADLSTDGEYNNLRAILEKNYHYWSRDTDTENTDPINYEGKWYSHVVKM
jgi:hypothetical protein